MHANYWGILISTTLATEVSNPSCESLWHVSCRLSITFSFDVHMMHGNVVVHAIQEILRSDTIIAIETIVIVEAHHLPEL